VAKSNKRGIVVSLCELQEVEITSQMRCAGSAVCEEFSGILPFAELAEKVYSAMWSVRPRPLQKGRIFSGCVANTSGCLDDSGLNKDRR
jgi:hypothetical protein